MKTLILAIDPGSNGGVVTIWPDGTVEAVSMPDNAELRDLIEELAMNARGNGYRPVCFMEIVGGFIKGQNRPGGNSAPGSAMFKFGDGNGYIRGCVDMVRIERRMIRPQEWQVGIPGVRGQKDKAVRKRALKEHAARIFPNLRVTLNTADALCLADYARRQLAMPAPAAPAQMEIPTS